MKRFDDFAAVPGDWLRPATLGYLAPVVRAVFGPAAQVLGAADQFRGLLMAASGEPTDRRDAPDVLATGAALEDQVGASVLAAHTRLEQIVALRNRNDVGDVAVAEKVLAAVADQCASANLPRVARRYAQIATGPDRSEAGRSAPASD